ncbi:multidrug ABC transporter ATPase [Streptomyces hygroscopicus]|uniref:ABC transporter ATP-binding protein n=1 Tax=Streptomyces hygroscopicus TaxID=1912 RepID=UPI00224079D1|nr:ABC transporter ATP-binding protein [Streptomyces hygroscopicus]MCW7940537.1 multidrug ABC transporter ATPase [Streptomyces hygroscopicus]
MEKSKKPPGVSLRRVLKLFAPYRVRLAVVLGLIVVSALSALVPPFLLREILDFALPRSRTGLLTLLVGGMVLLTVSSTAVGVLQSYLSMTVGQDVMNDLRNAVYGHLQRMSLAFFAKTRTGEVQSRIANDIGGMSSTVTNVATTIVASTTTVFGSLAAMIALDWKLTIMSVLILPIFVLISRRVGEERRSITQERQQQLALMSTLVEESLSVNGFLLGRVMGRSAVLTSEFARQSRELTSLTIRASMAGRWRQSSIQVIMAAMPVLIYWGAGLTADHGRPVVSIGTLIAFTTLQQGLFSPSVQLLQVGIAWQSSLALFERVFEYLDLPVDVPEPARPIPLSAPLGHVSFEHVDFSYGGERILHDITIDLPAGGHLAVVGPTGAGKTTLGYLISRLYDVSAGRVTIDGVDIRGLSSDTLADIIGVVSQDTHLFHTTISDNLRFAKPDATPAEVVAAAQAAQIHDLIAGLPDGYDTIVGERGHRFSGGERQRLAIARTMLRNPAVLVLDEATSALDTRTEAAVQQALDTLAANRTTITIAHRLSTVRNADQIIVLDHGRITERGSHRELLANGGHYAALVTRSRLLTATTG